MAMAPADRRRTPLRPAGPQTAHAYAPPDCLLPRHLLLCPPPRRSPKAALRFKPEAVGRFIDGVLAGKVRTAALQVRPAVGEAVHWLESHE
jgi:hypothetical protein